MLFEELLAVSDTIPFPFPKRILDLEKFSRKDACDLAEEIRARMNLGVYPAQVLVRVLENQYGIRFFSEDLAEGSAACTWYSGKPCILISASEPAWRQHFSVAHELFYLITWDEGLFQQVEAERHLLKEKTEDLANAFASGLLMPAEAVRAEVRRTSNDGALSYGALVAIARCFHVSLAACIFRLANLGTLSQRDALRLSEDTVLNKLDGQVNQENPLTPYQFGATFLRLGYICYETGKISRARLAKALDVSLVDLPVVLSMAGLPECQNLSEYSPKINIL